MITIAEKTFPIKPAQFCDWSEYGFRLDIPGDVTLLQGQHTDTVTITVSLRGKYSFPENHCLVSAVYWISPSIKFSGPVRIGIEHCASMSKDCVLQFVTASSTQESLPYRFKLVNQGDFASESRYGYLKTAHFSAFAIVMATIQGILSWLMPPPVYRAILYCEALTVQDGTDVLSCKTSCKMQFVVLHSLAAIPHVSSSS